VSASCTAHLNADKHVLRYLKGTSTMGITYGGEGCKLEADFLLEFADADYAGELKKLLAELQLFVGAIKGISMWHTTQLLVLVSSTLMCFTTSQGSVLRGDKSSWSIFLLMRW